MAKIEKKVIKEIGEIKYYKDVIRVEVVSYYGRDSVVNVQKFYNDNGEWKPSKRPAYDYEVLCELLPMLEEAKRVLEEGK